MKSFIKNTILSEVLKKKSSSISGAHLFDQKKTVL